MTKLLYIEASPRKQRSHSIAVAKEFLAAYQAANPDHDLETLDIWQDDLPSFDGAMLDAKYATLEGAEHTPEQAQAWGRVESLASQFKSADKYLLSVPMWNFSIPYRLKQYIDVISQPGLTWAYTPEDGYSGLCTGRSAALICSSGDGYAEGSGFEPFDLQKPYMKNWLAFLGIELADVVTVESTLFPQRATDTEAKQAARALAEKF